MRPAVRALPDQKMTCGLLLPASRRQRRALVGLERPSGRTPPRGVTPSPIMSPDPVRSAGQDKAGRQRAPHHVARREVVPVA